MDVRTRGDRLPQATIRARAERGAFRDAEVLGEVLTAQIDTVVDFVLRNLRRQPSREGVVREVIVNAVAHRDSRSTAPIQIHLDDTGLTVWNPGHLPDPITPAALRVDHPSVPTKPLIARVLSLAGYVGEWGTGTLRVIAAMEESGLAAPEFKETSGGVSVVLPLDGAGQRLPPRQATLLASLASGQSITTAEHAARAGVAHRTALGDLRELEAVGFVRRQGQGKALHWIRT